MRPFATGKTFTPVIFRGVEASLLEVAPAGFVFPIFKDRKASVGYQSGAAEFIEPVKLSAPNQPCYKPHEGSARDRITVTVLPRPSHQLAPKFSPYF